jgi:hypothetical protein
MKLKEEIKPQKAIQMQPAAVPVFVCQVQSFPDFRHTGLRDAGFPVSFVELTQPGP